MVTTRLRIICRGRPCQSFNSMCKLHISMRFCYKATRCKQHQMTTGDGTIQKIHKQGRFVLPSLPEEIREYDGPLTHAHSYADWSDSNDRVNINLIGHCLTLAC